MTRRALPSLLLLLPALAPACGSRSELDGGPCDMAPRPSTCVAPGADPCGPPVTVTPVCDAAAHAYHCPEGSRPYARAAASAGDCLPFSDPSGPIASIGGSLVRVPTDDGRCLWVAEDVGLQDGTQLRNVAFAPDLTAPFGTCPTAVTAVGGTPVPIAHMEGGDLPNYFVQLAAPFRAGGQTRIVYRLFIADSSQVFGVNLLGGGLARWDEGSQTIVVPGPQDLAIPTSLGLGDAAYVAPDATYLYGCPQPNTLSPACIVTRLDAEGGITLFAGGSTWIQSQDWTQGATVFHGGPWIASVVPDALSGALLHVYVEGFGSTLETDTATAPEGPWTAASSLGPCALPGGDTNAFCAGPVVHEELADPTRPGEVVVSYGVGTTATNQDALRAARPQDYWTRLAWLSAP
jgi:hypothetical protein